MASQLDELRESMAAAQGGLEQRISDAVAAAFVAHDTARRRSSERPIDLGANGSAARHDAATRFVRGGPQVSIPACCFAQTKS